MKIKINELRNIVRSVINEDFALKNIMNVKPNMVLRYTGDNMEIPAVSKVLNVAPDRTSFMVVDHRGTKHKVTEEELHHGDFTPTK